MDRAFANDCVDVGFALSAPLVPQDHGYALFAALCRVLGNLHGAPWLAVHPLCGVPVARGLLALRPGDSNLRLRLWTEALSRVLPLCGAWLDIAGFRAKLGHLWVTPLRASPQLGSRLVVIKGCEEPEPFLDATQQRLQQLQIQARVELGRRRVITIAKHRVVGFATFVRDLSDEDSLLLQRTGLGGRQRMGCGVFGPLRSNAALTPGEPDAH